jgi:hypothetical protein
MRRAALLPIHIWIVNKKYGLESVESRQLSGVSMNMTRLSVNSYQESVRKFNPRRCGLVFSPSVGGPASPNSEGVEYD